MNHPGSLSAPTEGFNRKACFLRACSRQQTPWTPVWLMRQAGRYLPEYRALKAQYGFLNLVKTPELAEQVTHMPLSRFDFDAAIIFSDILVLSEALGYPYAFKDKGGIEILKPFDPRSPQGWNPDAVEASTAYVGQAIQRVSHSLGGQRALIGFSASPWTLAAYMVQGHSCTRFEKFLSFVTQEPSSWEAMMEALVGVTVRYLKMQIKAGADALQIFDTWGSLCTHETYWNYSLRWIQAILHELGGQVPVLLYTKGKSGCLPDLLKTGASVISVDQGASLVDVAQQVRGQCALQGNLDPLALEGDLDGVLNQTMGILNTMKGFPGFIFNLGHGITPLAKVDNVTALVNCIRSYNPQR
jgi:uroporphyrinogen decarboxylase